MKIKYYVVRNFGGGIISVFTSFEDAWKSIDKTGGLISLRDSDDKEVVEFRKRRKSEDYIYIIISNHTPTDFQSLVIKYESWEKFINDIQDVNCTNILKGTMAGKLHRNNVCAVIDFKDNFHAKYHFEDDFSYNCYSTAYLIDKENMERLI